MRMLIHSYPFIGDGPAGESCTLYELDYYITDTKPGEDTEITSFGSHYPIEYAYLLLVSQDETDYPVYYPLPGMYLEREIKQI